MDFFISYNQADKEWAEWVAWVLEEAGYTTVIQTWDFRPGENFVLRMHQAVNETDRTIAILSENYLNAVYTHPEWANAFVRDPLGNDRTLIPVRVAPCEPTGLLKADIYIELAGLDKEQARKVLLDGFQPRGKPTSSPTFPGISSKALSSKPVTLSTKNVWQRFRLDVKEDLENRLKTSIHSARFIDLKIEDTPKATQYWVYKDESSHKEFKGIIEAFDKFRYRMLILGGPGSGKTTTILHIALKLLADAEINQSVPLPLILNLSKLKLDQPRRSPLSLWLQKTPENEDIDDRVERWLIKELIDRASIDKKIAINWLNEGRFAFLLDGLDEVDVKYRSEMVRVLNETFLKKKQDAIVVVCSRIHEYQAIHGNKNLLQLKGSVTLQSLTDDQIRAYLDATQATGLTEAILNDESLHEMAKRPLTLSMMVLAYGNDTSEEISENFSLPDRRHRLMEDYVIKMIQRKERRDRGIPFDKSKEKEVPKQDYAYTEEKIHKYMGWLALRLSVRMQTAYSFHYFYSFLKNEENREKNPSISWCIRISSVLIMFLGVLLAGIAVMPMSVAGACFVLKTALISAILGITPYIFFKHEEEQDKLSFIDVVSLKEIFYLLLILLILCCVGSIVKEAPAPPLASLLNAILAVLEMKPMTIEWPSDRNNYISFIIIELCILGTIFTVSWELFRFTAATMLVSILLAVGSHTLSTLVPLFIQPDYLRYAVIYLYLLTFMALPPVKKKFGLISLILFNLIMFSLSSLALLLIKLYPIFNYFKFFPEIVLAISQAIVIYKYFNYNFGLEFLLNTVTYVLFFVLVIFGSQTVGLMLVEDLNWRKALIFIASVIVLIFFIHQQQNNLSALLVLVPFTFVLGSIIGGVPGSLAAIEILGLIFTLFIILIITKMPFNFHIYLRSFTESFTEHSERFAEKYFYSPVLLCLLAITRCLPFRFRSFSAYSQEALLIKRSANDFEFVHRLLRDYFALRDLQPKLTDKDPQRRIEAIRSLGFQGESAIGALTDYSRGGNPDERIAAIWALGKITSPKVTIVIEAALNDDHPKVKKTAVFQVMTLQEKDRNRLLNLIIRSNDPCLQSAIVEVALREFSNRFERFKCPIKITENGNPSLQHLLKFLEEDEDSTLRKNAAQALGTLGDECAVVPLIKALSDQDVNVRKSAAEALGNLRDERAVTPLIKVLSDQDVNVRESAAEALGNLRDERAVTPLIKALSDDEIYLYAIDALGELGDSTAVEPLMKMLYDGHKFRDLFEALGKLGDTNALIPIVKALSDRDYSVRKSAAEALGQLGNANAEAPLIKALSDRDYSVRKSAAKALGQLKEFNAVPSLIKKLTDRNFEVRALAVEALGQIGNKSALPALTEGITLKQRSLAAEALGKLGDASTVGHLIKALSDSVYKVRISAALALGQLNDDSTVKPLIKALSDPEYEVRSSAAIALGQLNDDSTVEPLIKSLSDPEYKVRSSAAMALGQLRSSSAVLPLINALSVNNYRVRKSAVEALGQLKSPSAVIPLINALSDNNYRVRKSAVEALAQLEDVSSLVNLINALSDHNYRVRSSAAKTLSHLEDVGAVNPLIKTMSDHNKKVRHSATVALKKIGTPEALAAIKLEDQNG